MQAEQWPGGRGTPVFLSHAQAVGPSFRQPPSVWEASGSHHATPIMIAFSFLLPNSLDSLEKLLLGRSRGCGKLRNWPPVETRKGAPLIESSQRPAASAARRPADPLLAGALGRRPHRPSKRRVRAVSGPPHQASSPPPPGADAGCSDVQSVRKLRAAHSHLLPLSSHTEKSPFKFAKKRSQHKHLLLSAVAGL